jgi:hypothetical protein
VHEAAFMLAAAVLDQVGLTVAWRRFAPIVKGPHRHALPDCCAQSPAAPPDAAAGLPHRAQPAIERVREAVLEIKKTARRDPILAAAGVVLFIEKVSPALEHVDSSSGEIGTAVNHAIVELVSIVAKASADLAKRARWLEGLRGRIERELFIRECRSPAARW